MRACERGEMGETRNTCSIVTALAPRASEPATPEDAEEDAAAAAAAATEF